MNKINQFFLFGMVWLASIAPISVMALSAVEQKALYNSSNNHLNEVMTNSALRREFSGFFTEVLTQISPRKFFAMVDKVKRTDNPRTQAEWYSALLHNIETAKPYFFSYQSLKTLARQKKILAAQVHTLLKNQNKIDGYLEIGTPGTYVNSIKEKLDISGPIYVLQDQKRVTDYFQAFSLAPKSGFLSYDSFIELNDYAPIATQSIPDNSLDLVVCFIGIHHIPIQKLDAFIASIRRVLRPGGIFILRDHDAHSAKINTLSHVAHSVFNMVVPALSLDEEMAEYRNFNPLSHWIALLAQHGFTVGAERLVQKGDPTLNTMFKFTKELITVDEKIAYIVHLLAEKKGYKRDLIQTYLTAPEWLSVDMSQAEGEFLNKQPFYQFPYFKSIGLLWDVFSKSWNQAREKATVGQLLLSDYVQMNLFVCLLTSAKYTAKGIVSLPLQLVPPTKEGDVQVFMKEVSQKYGAFIEHTPFYEFDYFGNTAAVWETFAASWQAMQKKKGILGAASSCITKHDFLLASLATAEYVVDGVISAPIKQLLKGLETGNIQLLVKGSINEIAAFDGRIKVIEDYADINLKRIEMPRYKEFLKIMLTLPDSPIEIVEIAGQKEIQFKVRHKISQKVNWSVLVGCVKEYEWQLPTQQGFAYVALKVQVATMKELIKVFSESDIEILYMHDY